MRVVEIARGAEGRDYLLLLMLRRLPSINNERQMEEF